MRSSVGVLVLPVVLSAALAQAQVAGKADPGAETPAAPPAPAQLPASPPPLAPVAATQPQAQPAPAAIPLQQRAPGAPIPLGILPAESGNAESGNAESGNAGPGNSDGAQAAAPQPTPQPAPTPAEPAMADWIGRSFTVPQRTDIFTAPNGGAATSGSLADGADADVVGVLEGREWLKIRLPDGSFGFVRSASIPAVTAQAAAPPAAQPAAASTVASAPTNGDIYVGAPVQGPAAVHDTATLVVNERALPLYAVDGFGGEPALAMQQYVDSAGRSVNCSPLESKGFVCTLQDGTDVAKAALVNGAARVTPDAPAEYVAQQEDAQKAKRGIWRDGVDKVDAVPLSRDSQVVVMGDSFVPGVQYAGTKGVPAAFKAANPVNGLAVFGDEPFTLSNGDPTPVLYRPGVGWGFWDRYFVWRRAPASWIPLLEQLHPHGANIHQVNLTTYGFVQTQPYFVGPAVDVSFVPNQPPIAVGFSPYPSPVFAPYLDPGYVAVGVAAVGLAGIVGGVLPGPGGYGPPGGFRPGFGPGGFGPGGRPGFGPPGGPGHMVGFGGPGAHFGGPMGPGGHFGGPGGGAFGARPVGAPGMMGRPGGMPMGMGGRPGGMMGMGGRPGGMPMAMGGRPGGMGGRPGGMPMGMGGRPGGVGMGGRPGGMMGMGGRPGGMPMGMGGRPGGMMGGARPMPGGGGVHLVGGGAPGRHR